MYLDGKGVVRGWGFWFFYVKEIGDKYCFEGLFGLYVVDFIMIFKLMEDIIFLGKVK